jgi:Metallo-peptidase family M12B Reprolysin-like/Proprotein convertase P-domain
MKRLFTKIALVIFSLAAIPFLAKAQNSFFSDVAETAVSKSVTKRVIVPNRYRTVMLDSASLKLFLKTVTKEALVMNRNATAVLTIPMPNGSTSRFHIWESATMAPELAAEFSTIKTYTGQGIEDRTAIIKLDWTEEGFHAMVLSPVTGAIFIDPYAQDTKTIYQSYFKKDFTKKQLIPEKPPIKFPGYTAPESIASAQCIGTQLRTYRLAVACTGEYAAFHGGTVALAQSAIVTTVNRINGVYEKEINIRMILVANNTDIVYTNAGSDPFNNSNPDVLIGQSQSVIDAQIGNANYDMGHTFSTGGGGLSGLGIICRTGQKASTITGQSAPIGDPYDIDFVAHEIGHALGADHTFNSATGSCAGNGSNTTNMEPGSGSTIMAYAGICDADNIQSNSDAQFHAISLDEISTYTFLNFGSTCGTLTATGNTPPVVNAGANYIIPKSTPFVLTGSGTDANSDPLMYSWEQIDNGGALGSPNNPTGNAPLFRSFAPVASPTRYFPRLSDQVNNTNTLGEILPSYARTMRFRLTARDNRAGGGGVCFDSTSILVDGTAAAFTVTAPNTSGIVWFVNDFKTVTWNASTTAAAPISCANVTIQLSIDGGFTYPITLLASTPNDGTEEIQVPNNIAAQARIRVMAVGNIFYDISNFNFAILAAPSPDFAFNNPASVSACTEANPSMILKTAALGGFSNAITLSASGVPGGTTVSFGTNPVTPGGNTTVTLNGANTLAGGTYNITITGTASGTTDKTRVVSFLIGGSPLPPNTLALPAAYSIGVKTLPLLIWGSVAGASSYTLEFSTSSGFGVISQIVAGITTTSYTLTTPLAENTTYYWRVKTTNGCGTGAPSASSIFKTASNQCTTFTSTDVPVVIPASGTPTVTSTITIPVSSGVTITDLNVVGLAGNHTFTSDLTVSIKSPANSTVILFDRVCDDGIPEVDFNLNLDDESTSTIPCNLGGGITVKPVHLLSAFDGQSSNGVWTLTIKDNYTVDGGSLNGWGLNICRSVATPITYTFIGNGNWDVASNWVDNTIPPAILPANCAIDINPSPGGQCVLNIPSQRISTGASITVKAGKMIVIPGSVILQ